MLIMWQKQESKPFYPEALQQRHILIPEHLGAAIDNLACVHTPASKTRSMRCTLCVRSYGHLNVWSMTLSALCHQ